MEKAVEKAEVAFKAKKAKNPWVDRWRTKIYSWSEWVYRADKKSYCCFESIVIRSKKAAILIYCRDKRFSWKYVPNIEEIVWQLRWQTMLRLDSQKIHTFLQIIHRLHLKCNKSSAIFEGFTKIIKGSKRDLQKIFIDYKQSGIWWAESAYFQDS